MTKVEKKKLNTLKGLNNFHPGEGFNWDQETRREHNFTRDRGRGFMYYLLMSFGAGLSLIALFLLVFKFMN